jgi:hypothetical protein
MICSEEDITMPFTVTYNGNGNDGGRPPVDTKGPYNPGQTVSVAQPTPSSMTKTGATFAYWNTNPDGSGVFHGWPQDTFFAMPATNLTLYAQWFVTTGLDVSPGQTNPGATTHYVFSYDSTLLAGGLEPGRTNTLMSAVEADFAIMSGWFPGVTPNGPSPIRVYVTRLNGGANNTGDIRLKPNTKDPNELRSLLVSEITESFMAGQNKGWGFLPGVNNEESCGEALSLFLTQRFEQSQGITGPYTAFAANNWLNSSLPASNANSTRFAYNPDGSLQTDFGSRADYINALLPFPGNGPGTGCSILFLYYLYWRLGYSVEEIIAAAPGYTSGKLNAIAPLRGVYQNLTGDAADPFPAFKQILDDAFPPDQVSHIPGTTSGDPDNPFVPLLPRDVFSADDGILYAIFDNGDLLWYHHDGQSDGSFRWAHSHGRRVGVGWDFKTVFSGGNGIIYAITETNDLLWFRHDGASDGSFRWADNNGRKVGTGWDFKTVFSGGNGIIYAITETNDLLWFRHDGASDGSFRWADNNGRKVGTGWDFKTVFSGGDGIIYAITPTNDLLWFRHDGASDGTFRWTDNNGSKVGTGWDAMVVFSGGNGIIYAIDYTGDLLWYRHDGWSDGTFRWADNNARKVGVGWTFPAVIYAVPDSHSLLWYRHDGWGDGSFKWADTNGRQVGSGWNARIVFSGGDGVIYAITDSGDLLWYRHEGRGDGSFKWTDNNGRKVGTGWNAKTAFSGGDGVIYAITDGGDLLWYRHEGRGDGSFKWTDNNGRKVGTGWNARIVFSGEDGVIYAITDSGDLLWYRHEGRGDGSFKWTDNNGRKVGTGWNAKTAFSGGDGVIYAITDGGDLLWYRHEGRGDGSFKWTDNNGRKVGAGWTAQQVFFG